MSFIDAEEDEAAARQVGERLEAGAEGLGGVLGEGFRLDIEAVSSFEVEAGES